MATPVSTALAVALRAQQQLAGEVVTYRIDPDRAFEILAVPTAPQSELVDEQGQVIVHSEHRDWLVFASELEFEGEQIEPARGHVIEWLNEEDILHHFPVTPLVGTELWRWMDAFHVGMRIHTLLERTD